ncbi:sugar transferase [Kamptonema cortianum]|nr:sugar transferase [Geitlerinema splendidum]MDK3155320.1 sugar transferase [Kamptonema cortianum]
MKRTMDIVLSLIGLIVLFPLFLLIAILVMIDDGWPFFFKQNRLGKDANPFPMYKFRTMCRNAEQILAENPEIHERVKAGLKVEDDPRLLKFGKLLRKTSLDELPQLLNVLLGHMSLVGPRPILPLELDTRGDAAELYFRMKPGCAGLWQCEGRSDTDYETRVRLDEEYYWFTSTRRDIVVLWKTFVAVITGKGAQ